MGAAGSWAVVGKAVFLFLYFLIVELFWEFCTTNSGYWGFKKLGPLFLNLDHLFLFNEVWEQINCTMLKQSPVFIQDYKIVIHYFKNTPFFFFSASCWSCRRCLPETWIWCRLTGSKQLLPWMFIMRVYIMVCTIACLKSCYTRASMWVIEGSWLQKMELMKAGSVFWQVMYLVLVCWDTKQVDFTFSEISFKFPCISA